MSAYVQPRPCIHPDGCHRPGVKNRSGWCRMHGNRIERNGDPGPVEALKPKTRDTLTKDAFAAGNDFIGYGRLTCVVCKRPYVKHRITESCQG